MRKSNTRAVISEAYNVYFIKKKANIMQKNAQTDHPIHDLLKTRWSPRAFSAQPVENKKLLSLFEAARWAPSGINIQPWAFIVTNQQAPEPFAKLLGTLSERNQLWAKDVPVLVMSIFNGEREPGKPNPWAAYDLGQSVAHLSIQASALGLFVHQMGGFDRQKAAQAFELPTGYEPMTVFAIGYPGDPASLPDGLRERELETRTRKPLSEIVFDGAWKQPLDEKVGAMD
jgi:nitroreductase